MIYHITVKPGRAKDEVITDNAPISASVSTSVSTSTSTSTSTPASNLIVKTRKKAHDGEANQAVIKLLAEYFHTNKSSVKIIKGATSSHKVIEVL